MRTSLYCPACVNGVGFFVYQKKVKEKISSPQKILFVFDSTPGWKFFLWLVKSSIVVFRASLSQFYGRWNLKKERRKFNYWYILNCCTRFQGSVRLTPILPGQMSTIFMYIHLAGFKIVELFSNRSFVFRSQTSPWFISPSIILVARSYFNVIAKFDNLQGETRA